MAKRPLFIDFRGTKYFKSPEELEAFRKYMQPFNKLADKKDMATSYFADETVKIHAEYNEDDESVLYEVSGGTKTLIQGEYDKIYADDNTGEEYRWDGERFIAVNDRNIATDEETGEMLDHIFGGLKI